jgi:alanyl-tRNA synthetase
MTSNDIRQSFIEFFAERGHRLYPSAPLVPHGDPTLLFTNAGMVQFKDLFLGKEEPESGRAVSVQKCLRVSGKHNDLENVGPSPRHHTFFEMLGNFSFGDYFKAEAIEYGWDLVTRVWDLDPASIFATVYEEDDEAYELWRKVSGLPSARILRCGKADNFWAMGETGPCGPCSEIFVDREPDNPEVAWEEGGDSGRYLEIWNLVFMQFDRGANGELDPLPNPSIDTGAGLERCAAVLQGVDSNYDTDLFQPILRTAAELAGTAYGRDEAADVSLRVIADHLRAVSFLLVDGVIPGNEGRGYVLRRLLRRAVRHGMRLGFDSPFLSRLLPKLGEMMTVAYDELRTAEAASAATIQAEEEKFLTTVASSARHVQEAIELARREGRATLSGEEVFRFYDTYGLPLEMIREISEEERIGLDEQGFERELETQRRRSRAAAGGLQHRLASLRETLQAEGELSSTEFDGYDSLSLSQARVLRLASFKGEAVVSALALAAREEGAAVFDRTVLYAESGGQVGDQGEARWPGGRAELLDAQKDTTGVVMHRIRVLEGRLAVGQEVELRVDQGRRRAAERNHTATHLLHAALRQVLGVGVRQAGSLVAPERLRFDFTHNQAVDENQRRRIEDLVNGWIREALPTEISWRGYQEALAAGAMALFGEKYGERVRTVEIRHGEEDRLLSLELCGGCHVRNTGEIGVFWITSERSVASGVRRIEAVTGAEAVEWMRQQQALVHGIEAALDAPGSRAAAEIGTLKQRLRQSEDELARLRLRLVAGTDSAQCETEVAGIKVLTREVPPAPANEIRHMADVLRSRIGSGVVVLGSREDGRVSLVAALTRDVAKKLDAGKLVKTIARIVGGGGGGRRDFAQAGGDEPDRLPQALEAVPAAVEEQLG